MCWLFLILLAFFPLFFGMRWRVCVLIHFETLMLFIWCQFQKTTAKRKRKSWIQMENPVYFGMRAWYQTEIATFVVCFMDLSICTEINHLNWNPRTPQCDTHQASRIQCCCCCFFSMNERNFGESSHIHWVEQCRRVYKCFNNATQCSLWIEKTFHKGLIAYALQSTPFSLLLDCNLLYYKRWISSSSCKAIDLCFNLLLNCNRLANFTFPV